MTRKRAVKLLMARGYSRNRANRQTGLCRARRQVTAISKHITHICVVRESAMHLTGSQAAFTIMVLLQTFLPKLFSLLASL